jgi:hypothetical protein
MKKKAIVGAIGLIFTFVILCLTSCTSRDQVYGDDKKITIDLEPGLKFVSIQFESGNTWVTTRPREKDELPTTYTVSQLDYPDSGKFLIVEHSLKEVVDGLHTDGDTELSRLGSIKSLSE